MDESARNGSGFFEYYNHTAFKNRNLIERIRDSARVGVLTKVFTIFKNCKIVKP